MADYVIKRHDTWPPLKGTITEGAAETPVNLTGAVKVLLIAKGPATLEEPMVVTNATLGEVEYTWKVGDTATPGEYNVEFEVEWKTSPLRVETFPNSGVKSLKIELDLGGK